MTYHPILAGMILCFSTGLALSDQIPCDAMRCERTFTLESVSDTKSYALLLGAPETGCRRVRFTVSSKSGGRLGQTEALQPGELGLIRIGRGFAAGPNDLVIGTRGCKLPPTLVRRVTMAKTSPDHGPRASRYGY